MPCSRCGSQQPTTASIELLRGAHRQLRLLCTWCTDELESVLAPVDRFDADDVDTELESVPFNPDLQMELRRDNAA